MDGNFLQIELNASMFRQQLTYAEHNCFGSGATDASQRVSWSKKLSQADLNKFTSITYIDNEGWLNDRPF